MMNLFRILARGRSDRERLALKLRRRCQAVVDADRAGDTHVAAPVRAVRAVLALRANAMRSIDAARAERAKAMRPTNKARARRAKAA